MMQSFLHAFYRNWYCLIPAPRCCRTRQRIYSAAAGRHGVTSKPSAHRCPDRRRGFCRLVAGDYAAPGARAVVRGHGCRSGARTYLAGRARLGHRRRGAVMDFSAAANDVAVRLSDGATITTRLLVAADGARSHIRQRAGIASHGWSYPQSSIVTTVAHERDHGGRAEEHFLPAGPFAILPLKNRRCSIVWTEESREADRIVAMP